MKHFTQNLRWLFMSLLLVVGVGSSWGESVTYTISSKNTLSTTGTAPSGSSATIAETYNTSKQMTNGNSQTLTLSGFNGCTISNITLSMKSNSKGGAGKLSYSTDGGSTFTYIVGSSSAGVAFNNADWYGSWSTSYVNISKNVSISASTSNLIIKIEATANSLYCESYTLTYTTGGSSATIPTVEIGSTSLEVGESTTVTTDGPAVSLSTSNSSVASVSGTTVTGVAAGTATITATWPAGTVSGVSYSAGSKTFDITVTAPFTPTDGTFDFTGTYAYGSGLTPSSENTYIEESKTWTSGNVTLVTDGKYRWWAASSGNSLRIYDPSTGSTTLTLSVPSGKVIKGITITGQNLTGITSDVGTYSNGSWTGSANTVVLTRSSANTYFYTITVTYEEGTSGPVNPTFEWSSSTATATVGEAFTAPTLSNNSDGAVTYNSSDTSVATIDASGNVTILAAGSTTITASVAATSNYNAATASYTLTVSEATPQNQLVTVDAEGNVTFLFNDTGWGIPEGSTNKIVGPATYTNSGYSITIAGSTDNGFYYGNNYLLMGKSGAYLTLPAFDFDVERIEVVGTSTASESVIQNIYVGDEAVSTATTGAKNVTNSYVIDDAYQAQGNVYTLKVTSAHNTQITQIKVYKKSTNPSLSFSTASVNVYVEDTYTQTANAYNIGSATISYASSNAEVATVNASTGEVTGVSVGTATITAVVTVDGTEYTASYEVTVKKNNAELSFDQTVVSITENETYAGQTVTKPSDILDSEITYSSNNPAVATVDASTGAITLAGGIGTAIITATFPGNAKYNAATATYTLKVTSAAAASGDYEKVTSTEDLTDGEYLIVYEDGPVAFDGSLSEMDANSNYIEVTLDTTSDPYTIESTTTVDAAVFTLATIDGGYSIANESGTYIGRSSDSNGMDKSTTPIVNTISFDDDGNVNIIGTGGAYLRYNSDKNSWRFRYYKSSTYTGQKAIQLYKKTSSGPTVATPVITPETGTYETRPQTVSITCSTTGATIHYTTDGTTPTTNSPVYTGSFDIRKNTTVQAIAVATIDGSTVVSRVASSVITMKVNAPVFSPVDGSSFTENYQVTISADAGLTIYYITQDDKIFKSETGKTADPTKSTGELVSAAVVYSSPLTFGQSMMVTAICMDADGNLSDPVTVKYTYTGAVVPPYYSSFSASEGDFVPTQTEDGNTITGNGAPEWKMNSNTGTDAIEKWGEERYYMYVRGTSSTTNQTRTRWYGTADLTSPLIDLRGKANASFSFIHAGHHFYEDPNTSATVTSNNLETTLSEPTASSNIRTSCHVYIDDYGTDGSSLVSSADISDQVEWFDQAFRNDIANSSNPRTLADNSTTSRSGDFPRKNSGDISLEGYKDHYIKIRFSYTSTPQSYGTWNIDQITVNAVDVEELSMNSRGWTTYVFDHDIDAYATTQNYINGGDETLQIFKVTEFDHETAVMQQLGKFVEYTTSNNSERYIPAKTPVVIHGPAGANINFVLYTAHGMLPTVKNNLLIGSLNPNLAVAPTGSGVRYFVLQWDTANNAPYFNKVKEGRPVPDHKAYLNGTDQIEAITASSNPAKGIYVLGEDWEATGIESVAEEESGLIMNGEWYTLQGVRVDRPTERGIYIVNGKKILVK